MRAWIAVTLLFTALAGCVDAPDLDGATDDDPAGGPVTLEETFRGTVLSASTPAVTISPDQAGDAERWFYIHENTTRLDLTLRTNGFDLIMGLRGPGCHESGCAVEIRTVDREVSHGIEEPETGPWEVAFFLADDGAEEVYYELDVVKEQAFMHDPEHEPYAGTVVALHLGALRISPDQLGEVFREFWVHEGTERVTITLEASEDVQLVVGQSLPSRDRASEQGWDTTDGKLERTWDAQSEDHEDPRSGGWYFIIFHETDGPGVTEAAYDLEVIKYQDAGPSA